MAPGDERETAGCAARRRVLRVAIVQGGKVVEERLVGERHDVTVGQSAASTFAVPGPSALPRAFTLFEPAPGGGYALRFADGMDGRVALEPGSPPVPLAELARTASRDRGAFLVPLGDRARGRVTIGDVGVLFQLVAAPPVQPRPQLPPSVRGSLVRDLDWTMTALVGLALLGHFGGAFYLAHYVDWPRRPDIEAIPIRTASACWKFEKPKPQKVDPNAGGHVDAHPERFPGQADADQLATSSPPQSVAPRPRAPTPTRPRTAPRSRRRSP